MQKRKQHNKAQTLKTGTKRSSANVSLKPPLLALQIAVLYALETERVLQSIKISSICTRKK
jgi:hypothetical protein